MVGSILFVGIGTVIGIGVGIVLIGFAVEMALRFLFPELRRPLNFLWLSIIVAASIVFYIAASNIARNLEGP